MEKLEKRKFDKLHQYFVLRKEQDAIRQKYINEIRQTIFRSRGLPHQLNRAWLLSEVFYERDRQKEFNDKMKQTEKEERMEQAKETLCNTRKEKKEELEKRKLKNEEAMRNRQIYMKQ